ncbi:MAG: cellulase family glycosylhydrolase [Gammaproteobacteria bacterium]|nr:cellulase family glycosylhydrolase [Gammaproteobacteria bacterium]
MRLKQLALVLSMIGLSQASFAATFNNQISGVGPSFSTIYPMYCLQTATSTPTVTCPLSHGQSADPAQCSGNQYYAGGAIRFGGCSSTNTYLGYLDFDLNNGTAKYRSYQAPAGLHATISNTAADSSGNITGTIHYTPITANPNIIDGNPVAKNARWQYVGFNLSGLEFSKIVDPTVVPNLSYEDSSGAGSQFSDFAEVRSFLMAGFNTIRVPLRSSYLQMDGPTGPVQGEYLTSYVLPLLESLTQAGVTTIVDMHDYMRYSIFGTQYAGCVGSIDPSAPCPDGTINIKARDWVGLWVKFYNRLKFDPYIDQNKLMFDLNNEPTGIPDDYVFTIQVAIIKALRVAGFKGYILVSGNGWDGLHSWYDTWKSADGTKTYSNATLFSRANFKAAGLTDLSKIIINVHQYLDSDFSGNHDTCQTNLMTTGTLGFNLDAFTQWLQANSLTAMLTEFGTGKDSATCTTALTQLFNYLQQYSTLKTDGSYGYLGWTIWGVGHGWGDYLLRVTPTSYQTAIMKKYLIPVTPMFKHRNK